MSKNEKGFYIFFDWLDRLKELPSDESMKIIQAIGKYYRDGTDPTETFEGTIRIVVALMYDQIKRGELNSELKRQSVAKRWENRNSADGDVIHCNTPQYTAIQNDTTYNNITNNSITNNNITNNSITNNSIIEESNKEEKRKRFLPPSLDEVREYCYERQNNVNAAQFIDFYTANGWKVGKNSMKDWKATVRTWERNGIKNTAGREEPEEYDRQWERLLR